MVKIYKNNELLGYGKNFLSAITGCEIFREHQGEVFYQVLNAIVTVRPTEIKTKYGVIDENIALKTFFTFNKDRSISIRDILYINDVESETLNHLDEGYRWVDDDYPILDR